MASRARTAASTRRDGRRWRSSSTPTPRAPRSVPRSPTRSKRRCAPTPRVPSVASSRCDGVLDAELATLIAAGPQADVIIASSIDEDAIAILVKRRKATRLLSAPSPEPLGLSVRTFGDTALVQNADELLVAPQQWQCVTNQQPSPNNSRISSWRGGSVRARRPTPSCSLATASRSAIGAGQQSRVVSANIAVMKAGEFSTGSAAASDAFFPFADGLESLTQRRGHVGRPTGRFRARRRGHRRRQRGRYRDDAHW